MIYVYINLFLNTIYKIYEKNLFRLDGVICNNTWGDYEKAIPNKEAILNINKLYERGFYILIFTQGLWADKWRHR